MLLLALDTSTRQASVALCSEDTLFGEYAWQVGNNHSVELLERIQRLVAECGNTMQDIDGVAVATGPGSFNGLRVAVASAKALAFALQRPLVGVSTLDIIAAQQQQWHGPICSILDAGRSEVYAACYLFDAMDQEGEIIYQMRRLSDYLLLTPQDLSAYLKNQLSAWVGIPGERDLPPFLFCGEIIPAAREALHQLLPEHSFFVNPLQATRHASTLAMLAMQRILEGLVDDPLLLEPMYLRRPSITTSTRKQPLLGKKTQRSTNASLTEREQGALRR
ncbi:MAG TPA: tRNA (adenosine(37)-N6)-threonylcarbamoyltransferase complex dimerization subunit type 1 TsaB [Ktedonobacteraceae bacterium]|jgi:tRNA threonylcarbamoyladenosine biosynthesis protein TsaB|nr:tRNA (adenosine(37)-N6)-threonylcarbamoyltransferase complex dimerization subunit type 1 TsaB [Ktedonobacteraceae bacterium]